MGRIGQAIPVPPAATAAATIRTSADVSRSSASAGASGSTGMQQSAKPLESMQQQNQHILLVEDEPLAAPFSIRQLLKYAGPSLLVCIAFVDPGNLESDLQTGASAGYSLLWLLVVATIMAYFFQMLAAKVGVVTGKHLAELCRQEYPRGASFLLWIMTEVAIIGSDIQEVIGSAIALRLLTQGRLPMWLAAVISVFVSFTLLLIERAGVRKLEALFGVFVFTMMVCFGWMFTRANVPALEVLEGFTVPRLTRQGMPVAAALVGSLLMPHNFMLHSALVLSRGVSKSSTAVKTEALKYFGIESAISLGFSVLINTFIICVFAAGFYREGEEAPDIGLQNAGAYLAGTFGSGIVVVWGLGLLAAGQSSTMTGTYTGQFVMQGFLDLKVSPIKRILLTRAVALAPTLFVALNNDPDGTSLDQLNQALNLLQSVQLPFVLVPLLIFSSSRRLMGKLATKGWPLVCAWVVALVLCCVNMGAVGQVVSAWAADSVRSGHEFWVVVGLVAAGLAYSSFIIFIIAAANREPEGLEALDSSAEEPKAPALGWVDARLQTPLLAMRDTAGG